MPRREIAAQEFLANGSLFARLDAASRARIAAHVGKRRLPRGQPVFHRGESPAGFFIVVYGEITLVAHGARSPRLTGVVGPGHSFGEPMMFLGNGFEKDHFQFFKSRADVAADLKAAQATMQTPGFGEIGVRPSESTSLKTRAQLAAETREAARLGLLSGYGEAGPKQAAPEQERLIETAGMRTLDQTSAAK